MEELRLAIPTQTETCGHVSSSDCALPQLQIQHISCNIAHDEFPTNNRWNPLNEQAGTATSQLYTFLTADAGWQIIVCLWHQGVWETPILALMASLEVYNDNILWVESTILWKVAHFVWKKHIKSQKRILPNWDSKWLRFRYSCPKPCYYLQLFCWVRTHQGVSDMCSSNTSTVLSTGLQKRGKDAV